MILFHKERLIRPCRPASRIGFTILELLAAIAVVVILASLLVLGLPSMRGSTDQAKCTANLRQIYTLFQLYSHDHSGDLPHVSNATGSEHWSKDLLPYYTTTSLNNDTSGLQVCPTHMRRIKDVTGREFTFSYGMNGYLSSGSITAHIQKLDSIPDPARTILLSEGGYTASTPVVMLDPYWLLRGATYKGDYIGGAHKGMNNILWCDGHVSAFEDVQKIANASRTEIGRPYWHPGFNPPR